MTERPDIVERLNRAASIFHVRVARAAADEIVRLRSEVQSAYLRSAESQGQIIEAEAEIVRLRALITEAVEARYDYIRGRDSGGRFLRSVDALREEANR